MEMYRGMWEMHVIGLNLAREVVREAEPDRPAHVAARRPGRAGGALAWLACWIVGMGVHV